MIKLIRILAWLIGIVYDDIKDKINDYTRNSDEMDKQNKQR